MECQSRAARGRLRAVVSLQKLPRFLQSFCNCGAEVGPTEPRSLNGVRLNLLAEIKGHGLRGNYSRPQDLERSTLTEKNSNVERCAWALQKSSIIICPRTSIVEGCGLPCMNRPAYKSRIIAFGGSRPQDLDRSLSGVGLKLFTEIKGHGLRGKSVSEPRSLNGVGLQLPAEIKGHCLGGRSAPRPDP